MDDLHSLKSKRLVPLTKDEHADMQFKVFKLVEGMLELANMLESGFQEIDERLTNIEEHLEAMVETERTVEWVEDEAEDEDTF